jgi:transposase
VITYLTKNYKTIILGDMNASSGFKACKVGLLKARTKGIVSNLNNVISGTMKTACLRTRFFEFKQRLAYKCNLTKTNYVLVDERYTSKICSYCGNYNDKLKGEEIYNCSKCKLKIDRDVNSCRNMLIKSRID